MSSLRISPRVGVAPLAASGPVANVEQPRLAADRQRAARTIFMPVYSFGLCDAVTVMPPSSPSSPTAK